LTNRLLEYILWWVNASRRAWLTSRDRGAVSATFGQPGFRPFPIPWEHATKGLVPAKQSMRPKWSHLGKGGIGFVHKKMVWLILLAGFAVLFSAHGVPAQKADYPEKVKELIAVNFAREMMDGTYKAITVDDLKKWLDAKKDMLIVDTMPFDASYKKRHIPGAVQTEFPIPEMKELDAGKKAEFIELLGPNKDRLIVFYCGFTECTRSHNAAMWAVKLGYTNVYRFPGGIEGWTQAGYPAEGTK
jgi:thiosulfate/3-mercaptopyruvate sulfurtransferase